MPIPVCCASLVTRPLPLRLRQKLPKVNKELAMKLMEEGEEEALLKSKKKKAKVLQKNDA